ncbi:hypothetical protein FDK38_002375 [Candidozyma auris]|nr:hypothetical protein FDK38_002375 [[Candida] auris]
MRSTKKAFLRILNPPTNRPSFAKMPPDESQYIPKNIPGSMESPLHRLEQEVGKDLRSENHQYKRPSDTASIYSFESVSTSGRLLDRLDLDSEDFDEDFLRRRESYVSLQSTGRLLDRLGLEDDAEDASSPSSLSSAGLPAGFDPRLKPVRASSAISLSRMQSQSHRPPVRSLSSKNSSYGRLPLHSVGTAPFKQQVEKSGASVDSFHADMNSSRNNSTANARLVNSPQSHSATTFDSIQMPGSFPDDHHERKSPAIDAEKSPKEFSSAPLPKVSSPKSSPQQPNMGFRQASNSSQTSLKSIEVPIFNPNTKFDPVLESMVKQALQLRNQNDREASYKLQIAGNIPNNYPKAMHLYAIALSYGLGVKKNDASCVKWLCRCILVSQVVETNPVDIPSLNNYIQRLNELQPQDLVKMVAKSCNEPIDPFDLYDTFSRVNQAVISKINALNNKDNNTVGGAYHRLGEAALQGAGLPAKDTSMAMQFWGKAASLGYSLSMVKLGELWSTKSKHHKKDVHKAAAWLRLAELFGQKDIGNSWIYKSKYMVRPKK